jgi:hypothetical protein
MITVTCARQAKPVLERRATASDSHSVLGLFLPLCSPIQGQNLKITSMLLEAQFLASNYAINFQSDNERNTV